MTNVQAVSLDAQMVLAELFTNWPPAIRIFLNHKMGCVGCSMAPFDTIAEAAANYGIPLSVLLAEIKSSASTNNPEVS